MRRAWIALLFVACGKPSASGVDGGAPAPSATASATASVRLIVASAAPSDSTPPLPPPPPTDYKSLAQAEADGDKAIGKTVLISASRGALFADAVTLHPCVFDVREVRAIRATYTSDKRALVRAMPSTVAPGHCTRIVVKITGPKAEHGYEHAALIALPDVHPSGTAPAPPPTGVDFASTDELLLAGDAAAGKIAQIPVRRTSAPASSAFDLQTCDVTGVSMHVDYRAEQQAIVDALPTGFDPCRSIRVKMKRMTNRHDGTWSAELVGAQ